MSRSRKAELLEDLRDSCHELVEKLGALPGERFEEGRYESGWNGREILAHVAAIEWTYPRLIEIAQGAATATREATTEASSAGQGATGSVPTRTARGGIDSYNERQVAKRRDATVQELIDEFAKNREATIAAVEAADEHLFEQGVRSAGGVTGVLADVLNSVAVLHIRTHVRDIVGE